MKWILYFCCFHLLFFKSYHHFDQKNLFRNIGTEQGGLDLAPLLDQSFTYLGEGSQMYVFASKDSHYVLKLFKARHQKRFKFSRFLAHLQRDQKDWKAAERRWELKFSDTCRRYEMALAHLKEETGLVALHLLKTSNPLPVRLIDKSSYIIDLAQLPFIMQKKAILAPTYFRKNPTKHREATQALKDFFVRRAQKGFSDPRQSLSVNYGFIDDLPIQLDVGKIERFQGNMDEELKKIHSHIDAWTSKL